MSSLRKWLHICTQGHLHRQSFHSCGSGDSTNECLFQESRTLKFRHICDEPDCSQTGWRKDDGRHSWKLCIKLWAAWRLCGFVIMSLVSNKIYFYLNWCIFKLQILFVNMSVSWLNALVKLSDAHTTAVPWRSGGCAWMQEELKEVWKQILACCPARRGGTCCTWSYLEHASNIADFIQNFWN